MVDADTQDLMQALKHAGIDDLLQHRVSAALSQRDREIQTLKDAKLNMGAIVYELTEQAKLLTDENDELVGAVRRLQRMFVVDKTTPTAGSDAENQRHLSDNAILVLRAVGKRATEQHTFSSLRLDTSLDDVQLLEATNELWIGRLLEGAMDPTNLEAFCLSSRGREELLKLLTERSA